MPKILIIDDDAALRKTLRRVLEVGGFEVTEAENGKEGIKKVEAVGPELVLMDIIMPEQDGLETAELLRSSFPGVKIIAMSGGGSLRMNDLLGIAKKLGAHGRLEKPFTKDAVLMEIERVLTKEKSFLPSAGDPA